MAKKLTGPMIEALTVAFYQGSVRTGARWERGQVGYVKVGTICALIDRELIMRNPRGEWELSRKGWKALTEAGVITTGQYTNAVLSLRKVITEAHTEAFELDERRTRARAFLSTPDGDVLTWDEINDACTRQAEPKTRGAVFVHTAGKLHPAPETLLVPNIVLDLADKLDDPARKPGADLVRLDGTHESVQTFVWTSPGAVELYAELCAQVTSKIEDGKDAVVLLLCSGGRHRSVAFGEQLARDFGTTVMRHHHKHLPIVTDRPQPLDIWLEKGVVLVHPKTSGTYRFDRWCTGGAKLINTRSGGWIVVRQSAVVDWKYLPQATERGIETAKEEGRLRVGDRVRHQINGREGRVNFVGDGVAHVTPDDGGAEMMCPFSSFRKLDSERLSVDDIVAHLSGDQRPRCAVSLPPMPGEIEQRTCNLVVNADGVCPDVNHRVAWHTTFVTSSTTHQRFEVLGATESGDGVWLRHDCGTKCSHAEFAVQQNFLLMTFHALCDHGYGPMDSCPGCDSDEEHSEQQVSAGVHAQLERHRAALRYLEGRLGAIASDIETFMKETR